MSDPVKVRCPMCEAKLQVKPHLLGTTGKCPKCKQSILILAESEKQPIAAKAKSTSHLPATQKQKDFALALGCQFDDTITRGEISALIDIGKLAEEERRFERIESIENREFSAVNAIRNELIDSDDPPVSASTPRQMVDSLDDRDTCAVLITLPFDQIDSFDDLDGVPVAIASSNSMTNEEVARMLLSIAIGLQKHLGILNNEDQ